MILAKMTEMSFFCSSNGPERASFYQKKKSFTFEDKNRFLMCWFFLTVPQTQKLE